MDAIKAVFDASQAELPLVTADCPSEDDSTGGVDIIEVSELFSGPIADRLAIQETNLVALQNRVDYGTIFAQIKSCSCSLACAGYYNPILAYGEDPKRRPYSARNMYTKAGQTHRRAIACLMSLSWHQLPYLAPTADPFIYIVSRMGTTGTSVKGFVNNEFPEIITPIRKHTSVTLVVGFGIVTRVHFDATVEAGADGVVVGSRIVSLIKEAPAGKVPRVVEDSRNHCPPTPSLPEFKARTIITPSLPGWGSYVPEVLSDCLVELEEAHNRKPLGFMSRSSKLYFAESLTKYANGAQIWLKREGLYMPTDHKTVPGSMVWGVRPCVLVFGMECTMDIGAQDARRQPLNVFRMKMPDAKVAPVESGSETLKDAHRSRMKETTGKLRDVVVACVRGGSNTIGSFCKFHPGYVCIDGDRHGVILTRGKPGVLHGVRIYVLRDPASQIVETHSISAGLDYPDVGPEHSWLRDSGNAEYEVAMDEEALRGFPLKSSHALWGETNFVIGEITDVEPISELLPGQWANHFDWHI
ncbi:bifunctional tryptophan synthase TRP1 [Pisolithus orientalis]|uniref:bifunctional tryptophan synthase TRP1 n=1 Tax=Pisolithus orientalis TaxID=936130 RepID=UPI002224BD8E|nr:bifunctional tryptophan synthase TRP1 [Pisolithus orientalis]KAI6028849.1 bifunctional tryptophan synthase TRP1 [Pisolithus orientalis]